MKKSFWSIIWIATVLLSFGSIVSASDFYISDVFKDGKALDNAYTRILNEYDTTWWYSSLNAPTCDSIDGGVVITSPIVSDAELYPAPNYRLFLSPYRVSQLKNWDESIDKSKIIVKEYITKASEDAVFNLSTADGLDSNQVYYAFLLPINDYDEVWIPSNEFCFQIGNNMCVWDEACDAMWLVVQPTEVWSQTVENTPNTPEETSHWVAPITEDQHGAACAWMNLANVTHTISSDNVITLRWTSLWDGSIVQIAVFDPNDEVYKPLGSVKMDDENFSYKMQWDGEHNFSLTNWCKEVYYKVDAKRDTPVQPIVPAVTGPAENILYIAIAAIILYGVYAVFFRKSENK